MSGLDCTPGLSVAAKGLLPVTPRGDAWGAIALCAPPGRESAGNGSQGLGAVNEAN